MSLQTAALVKNIIISNSVQILRGGTSMTHVKSNVTHVQSNAAH